MQRQVRHGRSDPPGAHDLSRRRLLGNIAAFALAASTSGSQSAPILALARTAPQTTDQTVDPKDFGARGDGHADDASALQAALNTGKRVWLQPGVDYAFGTMLKIPAGGGFLGGGLLTMLTGPGKFDKADYSGNPEVGLFIESASNIAVEARIRMQPNEGIRTCSAIWVRGCTNVALDVEAWGFKETRFGVIEWNSNHGGSVKANVHDCFVNSTGLPTMQVTALCVDNNRLNSVNSTQLRFNVKAKDIYFGPTAIAKYSYQTDGVNLQGQGHAGHVGRVEADNVYEPLDCFSDDNVVEVVATNCYWGVKLIHGASRNVVCATVTLYMKAGVIFAGATRSTGDTQPVSHNRVYLTAAQGGQIGRLDDVAGAIFDGSDATYIPQYNYVAVTAKGDGTHLDFVVDIGESANNTIVAEGSGYSTKLVNLRPASGPGNVVTSAVK